MFHAIKLATYNAPTIVGQKGPTPTPVVVDGEEEWIVDKILQHRVRGKTTYYLVRWKGFTRDHDTWEPEKNLKNAKGKLKEYKELGLPAVRSMELDN